MSDLSTLRKSISDNQAGNWGEPISHSAGGKTTVLFENGEVKATQNAIKVADAFNKQVTIAQIKSILSAYKAAKGENADLISMVGDIQGLTAIAISASAYDTKDGVTLQIGFDKLRSRSHMYDVVEEIETFISSENDNYKAIFGNVLQTLQIQLDEKIKEEDLAGTMQSLSAVIQKDSRYKEANEKYEKLADVSKKKQFVDDLTNKIFELLKSNE